MIKIDIDMPKSCWGCKFAYYDSVYTLHCPFDDKGVDMFPDDRLEDCPLIEVSNKYECSLEQEIREEINHLSTYRVGNSNTDLVSLKAVERVLNLVFRGHRDKEPKTGHWLYNEGAYKCQFCGHEITGIPKDLKYCCKCGARMRIESEVKE